MRTMTTCRSEDFLAAVSAICGERRSRGICPCHALSIEVAQRLGCSMQDVMKTAHALAVGGVIRAGRTMNYEYYELKQK